MNLFELSARLSLDDSQFNTGIKQATTSGQNLTQNLKTGLSVGFSALKTGVTVATGALAAFGTGIVALAESTREYRSDLATLETAFSSVGNTVQNGTALYQEFYGLLGETDQAVEAANQLATIARNQEDVAKWTDISAGIMSTFQDSMPLETLTESVAQTSELGKITGVLADAVNRAGMSEDTFNAQLAELTTQQERAAFITDFLNDSYAEAGDMYQELNQGAIDARKAQESLNSIMADFGGIVEPLVTTGKTMLAGFLTPLVPLAQDAVNELTKGFETGGVSGLVKAGQGILQNLLIGLVENLPLIFNFVLDFITALGTGLVEMFPLITQTAIDLILMLGQYLAENAGGLVDGAVAMLLTLAQLIIENLPQIILVAIEIITAIITALAENAPMFVETSVMLMGALIQGLWQALPAILTAIGELIMALINMYVAYYGKWIEVGAELLNSLWTGAKNIWDSITSWFNSKITELISLFTGIYNNFVSIGSNIVSGLKAGISNAWNDLVNWFSGLFGDLIGIAERILGIASPSKVFKIIGGYTAEGFGLGFEDKFKNVSALVENSLDFSGAVTPINADVAGGGFGANAVSVIQNIYSEAKTAADLMQEALYQQERAVLLGA